MIDTDLPVLTTEDTDHMNSNRIDDEYDMEGEDSFDLSDEEEKGTNDNQAKMMNERAALRVMRSMTRSLAKSGD